MLCNPDPLKYTFSDGYTVMATPGSFWLFFNKFEETAPLWCKDTVATDKLV